MIHKDYCSRCKRSGIPLIKYSKNKTTQYYHCRSCAAKRHKDYMNTPTGFRNISNVRDRMAKKYPEKTKARKKVYYAVSRGHLIKSAKCEICGLGGRIEGHHMNYAKPLEVIWLCTACHSEYH